MDWLTFVQALSDRSDARTADEAERTRRLEAARRLLIDAPEIDDTVLSAADIRAMRGKPANE